MVTGRLGVVALVAVTTAGAGVGGVAHLIAQLQNPFPGLTADLGAAGKGTGYGSIGDACCFGDIL